MGDKKKKKDRLVWDDVVSKWVPQFGYKKVKAEEEKNWMIPVKGNAPDDEDPFEKLAESKREKVAKNELPRLRNLAKVKKVNVPSLGVVPSTAKPGNEVRAVSQSEDLRKAAEVAKSSTASLGKFKEDLERRTEKEKARESKGKMKKGGKGKRAKSHFANKGGTGKFTGKSKGKNRTMGQSKAQKKKANPSRGK